MNVNTDHVYLGTEKEGRMLLYKIVNANIRKDPEKLSLF